MPCTDGGPSAQEIYDARARLAEFGKLKERADKVTRLLCELLRRAERNNGEVEFTNELSEWWAAHQKEDEAREKREKAKKDRLKIELQRNIDKLLNQLQELD
jgi:hypothetical protein